MNRRRQRGFTLMEMLLAMTLLSLLLLALFGGLRFVGRGAERIDAVLDANDRLALVSQLLSHQVAAAFPLQAGNAAAPKLLFSGRPDHVAFPILRPPGQGPAGLILAVFDITRDNGISHLIYREYAFRSGSLVAVAETPTRSSELAQSAADMGFRFAGKNAVWQDNWSEGLSWPRLVGFHCPPWPDLVAALRTEPGSL